MVHPAVNTLSVGLLAGLAGLMAFALQPANAQQELIYGSQVPAATTSTATPCLPVSN